MQVTILGTAAGGPFQGRNYTAQIFQTENHVYLIDCGEGTQHQLHRYGVPYDRLDQIFISHLHGDHVFGLIGLLTSFCLKKRTKKLEIFSPPGLRELVGEMARWCGIVFPFPLEFIEVDASVSRPVFADKWLEVWTIPLNHRAPCSGWLFREKPRLRNIRKDKIVEYDIPVALIAGIKAGANLNLPDGRVILNAELTMAPRALRSYAFCSDTAPAPEVVEAVRGVDLLYHEATFTEEQQKEAAFAFHSTASQAAGVAKSAGVKKLLLGHFSGRYTDTGQHLLEACAVFPDTIIAEEGAVYVV